jgi:hypothetical protein
MKAVVNLAEGCARATESREDGTATQLVPLPCFFWKTCSAQSVVEKAGRSVCRACAATLRGTEYPLRAPTLAPLYLTGHAAAESLDMLQD